MSVEGGHKQVGIDVDQLNLCAPEEAAITVNGGGRDVQLELVAPH